MKPQLAIIAQSFFNPNNPDSLNIGGVETWLMEFVRLLVSFGYAPVLYQTSAKDFSINFEGAEVIGLGGLNRHRMTHLSHLDIDKRRIKNIVYANSFVGEKEYRKGQIFIQHGIHWDYTTSPTNFRSRIKWEFIRRRLSRHDLKMCRDARLTICVDSNFVNYARTMLRHRFVPEKMQYIPNFAEPREKALWAGKWNNPETINIIFARRFEQRRGVLIFAQAIEQILESASNIHVCFAGWGTFSDFIKKKFENSKQVTIQAIPHEQMAEHLDKTHIAVIPSTYSEGTSLSCLEAMASGCAVVASDVGGLGNIVLPDFNGLLIRPIADEITHSIKKLIDDLPFAEKIARQGHETISQAFSISQWQQRVGQALTRAGIPILSK